MVQFFYRSLPLAAIAVTLATSARAQGTLIARYHMDESVWSGGGSVNDDIGGHDGSPIGSPLPSPQSSNPAITGALGTCGYGSFPGPSAGGGAIAVSGLPVRRCSL
jgi:hypothetical protein